MSINAQVTALRREGFVNDERRSPKRHKRLGTFEVSCIFQRRTVPES
jgi:hypothetical protein